MNWTIYNKGNRNELFSGNITKKIRAQDVSPFIVGDPEYPLLSWLLKPYPEKSTTPPMECWLNQCPSQARMTVEDTLGQWRGGFIRFSERVDTSVTC